MSDKSSATALPRRVISPSSAGLFWGLLGVTAFSLTVPLTRIAVGGGMSPLFIGSGRAVVAAALAALILAITRQRLPRSRQWIRLVVVAAGVVVGFPLLTSFALTSAPASHAAVVIGILPAATAVAAVLRTHDHPPRSFWAMAGAGAVAAMAFAVLQSGGISGLHRSDLLLFAAVIAAAIGYAEGGLLARELGAWQTISWALVLSSPLMILLTASSLARDTPAGSLREWAAFVYLAAVSMFLAFFAWYRGLAIGPMANVSQVQLVQPVLSIAWAAVILHESLTRPTILGAIAVIICAALAVRTRLRR